MVKATSIARADLTVGQSCRVECRLTKDSLLTLAGQVAASSPERLAASFGLHPLCHDFIVQGLWAHATIAGAVLAHLPGPGTQLLAHHLEYGESLSQGELASTTLTVTEVQNQGRVLLQCQVHNEAGAWVARGTLLVQAPEQLHEIVEDALQQTPTVTYRSHFEALLRLTEPLAPVRTAVIHPVDELSLLGAVEAARRQLIEPVLVGPQARIQAAADLAQVDISTFELLDTRHSHAAAAQAAELAAQGTVAALMKGALHTDEMMRAILQQKELRTDRRLSHVWAVDVPTYPRLLLLTDAAINIAPDLNAKRDIIQNVLDLAAALNIREPKVAILAATEEVLPNMPATMDAAALCKMAERGQIRGGCLDGPLAFDNAVSEQAAKTKNIRSAVAGRADILVAPDIEAGNLLGKQLSYLADAEIAGLVLGAQVPIILTSRADSIYARIVSAALAQLRAEWRRLQTQQEDNL